MTEIKPNKNGLGRAHVFDEINKSTEMTSLDTNNSNGRNSDEM